MKLMILGGTGMLGHKLYQSTRHDAWVTIRGEAYSVARFGFYCADRVLGGISADDLDSVRQAIDFVRPDVVVNCIGVIKQHPSAQDPAACIAINALLPHRLATLCAKRNARLIHISTDCVFDGRRGGYTEADLTNAEDLYGRTKALGETSAPNAITLRTSIIGRELTSGYGLVDWFLAHANQPLTGYAEARFSGFTTDELAKIIDLVIDRPDLQGLYQVAANPIDKHRLLGLLRDAYGFDTQITPRSEPRIDRALDGGKFHHATGYVPPSWPDMIRAMVADPTPYSSWRQNP